MNFDSNKYWEERNKEDKEPSGMGSYGKLADFKKDVVNKFLDDNNIKSIIDYGAGDGNQLKMLNTKNRKYIGTDISNTAVDKLNELFKNDDTKTFLYDNEIKNIKGELVLTLDVLFHLIENDIYDNYMKNLFDMSDKFVIIFARNENVDLAIHVKFRKFTDYIENNFKNWKLIKHIPNKYSQKILGQDNDTTSPSDFYIYEKI